MQGQIDLTSVTVKCLLLDTSSGYTVDPINDEFVSNVPTGAEPSDASYSRQTLTGLAVSEDSTDDEAVFDADDVTFSSLSTANDIQAVIVYIQRGGDDTTPADDEIVAAYDNDSGGAVADLSISTNGSDLVLNFSSEGIINL